jgi:hypothetical protein
MKKYEVLEWKIILLQQNDIVTLSLEDIPPDASDDAVGDFEW